MPIFKYLFKILVFESSIDLYIHNTLKYITIENSVFKYPVNIPQILQNRQKIISYFFDRYNKCLYYLLVNGLFRKCYNSVESLGSADLEIIIPGKELKGFTFDAEHDYLYYFTKSNIHILNMINGVQKTFYTTNRTIISLAVFSNAGFYFFNKRRAVICEYDYFSKNYHISILKTTGHKILDYISKTKLQLVNLLSDEIYHFFIENETIIYNKNSNSFSKV